MRYLIKHSHYVADRGRMVMHPHQKHLLRRNIVDVPRWPIDDTGDRNAPIDHYRIAHGLASTPQRLIHDLTRAFVGAAQSADTLALIPFGLRPLASIAPMLTFLASGHLASTPGRHVSCAAYLPAQQAHPGKERPQHEAIQ